MTRTAVADLMENWLASEHVKWELPLDVIEWAQSFGSDFERAWNECPRADYLVALAGAVEADRKAIVTVVCQCARATLAFVPRHEQRPRRAVHVAESWLRGRPISDAEGTSDIGAPIFDAIGAEEAKATLAEERARPTMEAARLAVVRSSLEAGAASTDEERLARAIETLLGAHFEEPSLKPVRGQHERRHARFAFAHATRAASSCHTVATSAHIVERCTEGAMHVTAGGRAPKNVEHAREAMAIARRSGARVYTEAAHVFVNAARAHGRAKAAEPESWASAVAAFVLAVGGARRRPTDDVGEPPNDDSAVAAREAMSAALERIAGEVTQAKLGEYADMVRAELPFSTLGFEADRADGDALGADLPSEPRERFRAAITRFLPVVKLLEADDALSAAETVLAILDAPGPLDRKALGPVVRTMYERVALLFRQGAEEATGKEREERLRSALAVDEDVHELDRWLAQMGGSPPS